MAPRRTRRSNVAPLGADESLARNVLYPELFSDDLRPFVREFYTRAYHQTPSAAQIEQLLAGSIPDRPPPPGNAAPHGR